MCRIRACSSGGSTAASTVVTTAAGAAAGEVGVRGLATRALSPLTMQRSNKAKKSAVVRAGGGARQAGSPVLAHAYL
jgi:hypothetical protein